MPSLLVKVPNNKYFETKCLKILEKKNCQKNCIKYLCAELFEVFSNIYFGAFAPKNPSQKNQVLMNDFL